MRETEAIWILSRARQGDLNQMIDLADAVGATYAVKKIGDAGAGASDLRLDPPPQVLISAERAVSETTLALKSAAKGRTKAVSIGRPGLRIDEFDLVITAPHYRLRPAANILELAIPLHRIDPAALRASAEALVGEFDDLKRPITTALVGASSGCDRLDAEAARELAKRLKARVKNAGGSLIVATSPRTSEEVAKALEDETKGFARLYLWSPDQPPDLYAALLAVSDEFVATSDSASMPVEAALTGKPVMLYRLPRRHSVRYLALEAAERARGWFPPLERLFQTGVLEARADRRRLFDPLERQGVLRDFSSEAVAWTPRPLASAVDQAAAAIRGLLAPAA